MTQTGTRSRDAKLRKVYRSPAPLLTFNSEGEKHVATRVWQLSIQGLTVPESTQKASYEPCEIIANTAAEVGYKF